MMCECNVSLPVGNVIGWEGVEEGCDWNFSCICLPIYEDSGCGVDGTYQGVISSAEDGLEGRCLPKNLQVHIAIAHDLQSA